MSFYRKVGGLQEKEVYAMKVDNQTGKDNYADAATNSVDNHFDLSSCSHTRKATLKLILVTSYSSEYLPLLCKPNNDVMLHNLVVDLTPRINAPRPSLYY